MLSNRTDASGTQEVLARSASEPRPAATPYEAGRREWMERYGDYIQAARQWRLVALASLLINLLAVAGMGYSASQNHFVPFVVAVDKLGMAVAAGRADVATRADPRIVRAQLARWMASCRAVFVDAAAQRSVVSECYSMITKAGSAYTSMNTFFRAGSPFERAEKETVSAEVHTVLPVSEHTWRVEWTETTRGRNGELQKTEEWQASVTVLISPPSDEPGIQRNPLGVYVAEFNWTKRL